MIMNDPVFSSVLDTEESGKATKKRGALPWLYVHFQHPISEHVSAHISTNVIDRGIMEMRLLDAAKFPHGKNYVRVRATGKDIKSLNFFRDVLSRLLTLYQDEDKLAEIISDYREIIPDFAEPNERVQNITERKNRVEIIEPRIFLKGYSRRCGENRIPTIVTAEEAQEYKEQNKPVLIFPRREYPGVGERYPSDGVNPNYYVCTNPEFPYPGVQYNTMLNSKEYPVLPCCFKNPQDESESGPYAFYYKGKDVESKVARKQDLITTNKFLEKGHIGVLSDTVAQFLQSLYTGSNFVRYGTGRSVNSLLSAVLLALDLGKDEEKDKEKDEEKARSELAKDKFVYGAKQSCYDKNEEDIKKMILNMSEYFDPLWATQLLELKYNVNIYLFGPDGPLLPRYTEGYYTWENNNPVVMIYQHMGSESDRATYPQCELIVLWPDKIYDKIEKKFEYNSKYGKKIRNVYEQLTDCMSGTRFIRPVSLFYSSKDERGMPLLVQEKTIKPIGQAFDSNGKVRRLDCKYQDLTFTILTDPLPPLLVKKGRQDMYRILPSQVGLALQALDGQILSVNTNNNQLRVATRNGWTVLLPYLASTDEKETNITKRWNALIDNREKRPIRGESELDRYRFYSRLSKFIKEAAVWLLSNYLHKENITLITDDVLVRFARENFVVNPEVKYEIPGKEISKFLQNNKLILDSTELLKRVFYVVKLFSLRHIAELRTYYKQRFFSSYYSARTDFKQREGQYIFSTTFSVNQWKIQRKTLIQLHNTPIPSRGPYFFTHPRLSGLYIVQPAESLAEAFALSQTWIKLGYNMAERLPRTVIEKIEEDLKTKKYSYDLYLYESETVMPIVKVVSQGSSQEKIEEIETDIPVQIMGYKKLGESVYSALLPI
jgi:hypothetical protein